jgi:hypothetical protein
MKSAAQGQPCGAPHSTAHGVNPQLQTKLFTSPLEIRQQIYSYLLPCGAHVYFRQNKLCISRCFDRGQERRFGDERRVSGVTQTVCSDRVWHRRLRSTWGPHWECEELACGLEGSRDIANEASLAFMQVCKRAYVSPTCRSNHALFLNITATWI